MRRTWALLLVSVQLLLRDDITAGAVHDQQQLLEPGPPGPTFPREIAHANLSCPGAAHPTCLLGGGHGCSSTVVGGAANCAWPSLAAAKAECGGWAACGGLWCVEDGRCFARSWDSPLHTGAELNSTVYLKNPPSPPGPSPPPQPSPGPPPPYPKGFPPQQQPAPNTTGWTHGWACISCPGNSMLSANIGTNDLTRFNLTSPWWIKELADHYAHIQMSPFLGSNFYNDTTCTPECLSAGPYACTCGEHPLKTMARELKKINPAMKVQLYQAVDRGDLTPFGSRQIQAHPEWWQHDDYGNIMYMNDAWRCPPDLNMSKIDGQQQCHPICDWSSESYREWFRNFPLQIFGDDAAALFDGLMVDGSVRGPGLQFGTQAAVATR